MLTSKQRSFLRGLANTLDSQLHIGKADMGDTIVQSLEDLLSSRELVKVSVLKSAVSPIGEIANGLAEAVGAEVVQVIGRKFVVYRRSDKLAKEGRSLQLPR